eukprot:gene21651-26008_t
MKGDPVIDVVGMSRRYGSGKEAFDAVRNLDLSVQEGELFGLLGTNGAGKTSTLEVIQGLSRASAGTVRVLGMDPVRNRKQIRPSLGIMLQKGGLPQDLTARESLAMWAGTCSNPLPVDEVLERVDMRDRGDTRVKFLSGGEARRLDLACAIIGRPLVLFLDEPTTGLDPESRRNTWQLIADLKASGVTIMLTTHYLDEAESLCDQLAIMHRGSVVRSGTVADVVADHPAQIKLHRPGLPLPALAGAEVRVENDLVVITTRTVQETLTELLLWAQHNNILLTGLDARAASLETVFLSIADQFDHHATLEGASFTLLGRNRLLLFNAIVLPLIFPVGMLYLSRDGGLSDKSVSAGLEVFALFLLVFVVFYNLLSVYATRRDELVLKRLRTGECSDAEILAGPAVPSWVLTGLLSVVIGIAVMVLGGSAPVNPVLVLVAVIGGAALFTALALITSAVTRNAEAAQITCMPILILATAGMSSIRNVVPDNVARILDFTPLAAVVDLLNLGWLGRTTGELADLGDAPGAAAGFVDTFGSAAQPLLVMLAWIVGSVLIANVHFRWEPRS